MTSAFASLRSTTMFHINAGTGFSYRAISAFLLSRQRATIGLQRSHLPRDAGIQQWTRASLPVWRPGIYMEIPSARPLASTIGCWFVDDAAEQAERDGAIVAQLPDPSLWIPRPTDLLHLVRTATSAKATRNPASWSWAKRGRGDSQSRSATMSSTVLNRFWRCPS